MITPALVATWIAGGAASAFGGWLFHKFFKMHRALEARVADLED